MLRLRHVFTTTGATIISGGLGLLLTLLVARLLSPSQNGHYAQYFLVSNLYYLLISCGLGPASTYLIASGKASERSVAFLNVRLVSAVGALSLLVGALAGISGAWQWVGVQFNLPDSMLAIGLVTGFALLIFNQAVAILFGKLRFDTANFLIVVKAALPVVLIGVAVILWRNETGFAFATMAGFMVIGLMSAWYVLGQILRLPHEPETSMPGLARSVFRYGGYVYGANLLHYVATRGLLIVLSYFYAAEYVGFFSVALVLVETVLVVPSVVGQLLFPQSSKASFDYGLTDRIIRFNVYIGLLTIALVLLLAEPIIEFVLGVAYRPVSAAFVHLTPSILFMAVPRILSYVLSGQGHPEYPLTAAALSVVIGGGVAIAIVPAQGVVGAAWAANLISAITAVVTTYGYTHLRGVGVREVFAPRRSDVAVFWSLLSRIRGFGNG